MAAKQDSKELATLDSFAIMDCDEQELREIMAANLGGINFSVFDFDRIKVPSGGGIAWEVPTLDGPVAVTSLDCIILYYRDVRSYWKVAFEDLGGIPPDCISDDSETGYGKPGGECAACPLAKFKSADKGEGQACKQTRMMFIMLEESVLPVLLSVPPTSIRPVFKYFLRLAGRRMPYYGVKTKLGLEKTKSKGGIEFATINPDMAGALSAMEQEKIMSVMGNMKDIFSKARPLPDDFTDATEFAGSSKNQ